jgi:hypothetical protein
MLEHERKSSDVLIGKLTGWHHRRFSAHAGNRMGTAAMI